MKNISTNHTETHFKPAINQLLVTLDVPLWSENIFNFIKDGKLRK